MKKILSLILIIFLLTMTACGGDTQNNSETGGANSSTPSEDVTEPGKTPIEGETPDQSETPSEDETPEQSEAPSEDETPSEDGSEQGTTQPDEDIDLPKIEF